MMIKTSLYLFLVLSSFLFASCQRQNDHSKLLLGKWDCTDYADTVSNKFKGRPPVFISTLYESGYFFKRKGHMWVRDLDGSGEMFTNKDVDCGWELSEDEQFLSLLFPDDVVEEYEIIHLSKKEMTLRGVRGFWAGTETTYVFEKVR